MAGNYIRGSDGNPTQFYNYLLNTIRVKKLYIIQGNHDLPPKDCNNSSLEDKINIDKYILKNGEVITTQLGKIGGVNGIISNSNNHPYKINEINYMSFMNNFIVNKIDILLTHDTPRFIKNNQEFIGKDCIYEKVKSIKPKVYIYGHCHHPELHTIHNNIHFLNVDGRVVLINFLE
jgi:hypothetical protein